MEKNEVELSDIITATTPSLRTMYANKMLTEAELRIFVAVTKIKGMYDLSGLNDQSLERAIPDAAAELGKKVSYVNDTYIKAYIKVQEFMQKNSCRI